MSKFKVGDRVLLREDSEFVEEGDEANPLKVNGRVTKVSRDTRSLCLQVNWDNGTVNSYTDIDLDRGTVHDSKLARNLYKNQIEKIEGGLIYLK